MFKLSQTIFTDVLGIKRAKANNVPKKQNFEQKPYRLNIAQEMLTTSNEDPVISQKAITADESAGFVIEVKAQSSQWKVFRCD